MTFVPAPGVIRIGIEGEALGQEIVNVINIRPPAAPGEPDLAAGPVGEIVVARQKPVQIRRREKPQRDVRRCVALQVGAIPVCPILHPGSPHPSCAGMVRRRRPNRRPQPKVE